MFGIIDDVASKLFE